MARLFLVLILWPVALSGQVPRPNLDPDPRIVHRILEAPQRWVRIGFHEISRHNKVAIQPRAGKGARIGVAASDAFMDSDGRWTVIFVEGL